MARYLEIRNAAGNMIVDDESGIIQTMALTKILNYDSPVREHIDSRDGLKPFAPYAQNYLLDRFSEIRGHTDPIKSGSGVNLIRIYRVLGDIANLPYAYMYAAYWTDTQPKVIAKVSSIAQTPFQFQCAWLKLDPYNIPRPDSALLAYNEDGDITFDSALGYVHHVASKTAVVDVRGIGDFSVMMADISGLGLDTSKLFLRCNGIPRLSQWEYGASTNFYRVGYRSFVPRLRVTNGIVYVDFKRWVPYGYNGNYAEIYQPNYSISVYYIPAVRSF